MEEGLNEEQAHAFNVCMSNSNVLITGPAGVGKSFVLSKICEAFTAKGRTYAITASTGASAVLIEGMTLHRWAGIGLGTKTAQQLAKDIINSSYPQARDHWKSTDCLIIDEVSMIDADLFEKLEMIGRLVRKNNAPFGGLQVILCGDFAQLPPVKSIGGFCFQSKIWPTVIPPDAHVSLTKIIRQTDADFKAALMEIRVGLINLPAQRLLRGRVGATVGTDLIRPTVLLSNRAEVDSQNQDKLDQLPGSHEEYRAIDKFEPYYIGSDIPDIIERMNRDMQARETLELKVGAQVMLIYNHSNELVNGSRGVITGFQLGMPRVLFLDGSELIVKRHPWKVKISDSQYFIRLQIPLILAWVSTIHKCQGATLDCVEVDISKCFEYGQAYVALSRVRNLKGMSLRSGDLSRITASPVVRKFYSSIHKKT